MFDFFAFYSNESTLQKLIEANIDGIIVDWENLGKSNRQNLYNTQINKHTVDDLKTVGRAGLRNVICRINGPEYWSKEEVNSAIDLGASEILVPMIRNIQEAEFILNTVDGRVKVGLMLETTGALSIANQLNELPVYRFFVGLNDLSIERKSRNLFEPLVDGTIDELRPKITKHFGVAGLTHPASGYPIPCSRLIEQMQKHKATFAFLRRAFYKDLERYSATEILDALRNQFSNQPVNLISKEEERQLFTGELI